MRKSLPVEMLLLSFYIHVSYSTHTALPSPSSSEHHSLFNASEFAISWDRTSSVLFLFSHFVNACTAQTVWREYVLGPLCATKKSFESFDAGRGRAHIELRMRSQHSIRSKTSTKCANRRFLLLAFSQWGLACSWKEKKLNTRGCTFYAYCSRAEGPVHA